MFHTYNDAELKIPAALWGLDSLGERTWSWVELALHIPYYYVSINISDEEGNATKRHFLFSQLDDVLNCISSVNEAEDAISLGLFSPGYMNGTDFYAFGKVKEVWVHRNSVSSKFILDDGAIMIYSSIDDELKDGDFSLAISL